MKQIGKLLKLNIKLKIGFIKNRVFLRGDASQEIGYGHFFRLLSIANCIKNYFDIHFITNVLPDKLKTQLDINRYTLILIKNENQWIQSLTSKDIVIVDNYNINIQHHNKIKLKGSYLICIDDLHDKKLNADLIINHTPGINESDYITKGVTKFALGLEYALLRDSFYNKSKIQRKNNNIFICIGGTDVNNFSKNIVSTLLSNKNLTLNLLTDKPHLFKKKKRLNVFTNLNSQELCNLLDLCEFSVVSSSTIAIEAIFRKTYVIFGQTANNQILLHNGLIDYANTFSIGKFDENSHFKVLSAIENKINSKIGKKLPTKNKLKSLFKHLI